MNSREGLLAVVMSADYDTAIRAPHLYADDGFGNMVPVHPVTLVDGTVVSTWSEAWRHECEARAILAMKPLAARRAYLYGTVDRWNKLSGGIVKKRGPAAVKRLEDTMLVLWHARNAAAKQSILNRPRAANDNTGEE